MAELAEASAGQPTKTRDISSEAVIQIRNLSKSYRDFWGRTLDVKRGEIFGLLGPNGSGKTTTIKLLLGLLFPTSGEATVLGKPASDVRKNERIGYLPEESYLYKFLTAEETLDFYGRLFDIPARVRRQRADSLIKQVGLNHARKRILREYSKGMTRRIGLAQCLINDPELVLLDEPTSGLDPIGTREMKNLILQLRDQGKTVVLCSHLLADVQDVCDRIAILHQGELKVLDEVKELISIKSQTQFTVEGLSESAKARIRDLIASEKAQLISEGHPATTLEDLFLEVVRDSEARPGRRVVMEAARSTESDAAGQGG
jgi:ABC-2 type transport system ATP-binding protein